jgi:hypothetical protein
MEQSQVANKSGCGCGSNANVKKVFGDRSSMTDHQKELMGRIEKAAKERKNSVYKTKTPLFL